jgi:hypothetical protein
MAGLNLGGDIIFGRLDEAENCCMNRLWVCAGSAGA